MLVDEKEAFGAMFLFLEKYWERVGRPVEIGDLLSGLQSCADGLPFDQAHWTDWLGALEAVKAMSSIEK
jgi:hypothetical protein